MVGGFAVKRGQTLRDAQHVKNNEKWKFVNNILLEKTINDFISGSAPSVEPVLPVYSPPTTLPRWSPVFMTFSARRNRGRIDRMRVKREFARAVPRGKSAIEA